MSKRLCKLNRHDITAQLSDITRLVSAPKYICRSCARSSADKNTLCKPEALAVDTKLHDVSLATEIKTEPALQRVSFESAHENNVDAKHLKKQAKKQKKYAKKLSKAISKQEKLLRKQQKIEAKFSSVNQRLYQLQASTTAPKSVESLH